MRDLLAEAMAQLEDAEARLAEALDAVAEARDEVHDALTLSGVEFIMGAERIDQVTLRRLYWGLPRVHVSRIADALGVMTSEVWSHVGTGSVVRKCRTRSCPSTCEITPTSRSTAKPAWLCEACSLVALQRSIARQAWWALEEERRARPTPPEL